MTRPVAEAAEGVEDEAGGTHELVGHEGRVAEEVHGAVLGRSEEAGTYAGSGGGRRRE